MIDDAQAKLALASPLGLASPLNVQPNGCIGAGDAGFFCKYVVEYLSEAGFPVDQLNRGGYTIRSTLDRGMLQKMKRPWTRGAAVAAQRRQRDGHGAARSGQAPRPRDGLQPHLRPQGR